jgi:hypothetical protein
VLQIICVFHTFLHFTPFVPTPHWINSIGAMGERGLGIASPLRKGRLRGNYPFAPLSPSICYLPHASKPLSLNRGVRWLEGAPAPSQIYSPFPSIIPKGRGKQGDRFRVLDVI